MIEISIERDKITKSLNELENQFKNGNISKRHYEFQKRQLNEKLETLAAVETVMKLQGKETVEVPSKASDENENEELFEKFMAERKREIEELMHKKNNSQNVLSDKNDL